MNLSIDSQMYLYLSLQLKLILLLGPFNCFRFCTYRAKTASGYSASKPANRNRFLFSDVSKSRIYVAEEARLSDRLQRDQIIETHVRTFF